MEEVKPITKWWEQQLDLLQKKDVIVADFKSFPMYQKEFVFPHLTIGLNLSGTARAQYDLHYVTFEKNDLAVVLPNHILFPLNNTDDYHVKMLMISSEFVKELKMRTLSHDYAKFHVEPSFHLTDMQVTHLLKLYDLIQITTEMDDLPNQHEMLIYLLNVAFEFLNVYRREMDEKSNWQHKSNDVFNRFCDLLAMYYCKSHEVGFYADKLCISAKYFSRLILQTTGISAAQWITEYVIVQAKRMLRTRIDLNIQGISNQLGFSDQASFSRYFHRATGMTPKEYRKLEHIDGREEA